MGSLKQIRTATDDSLVLSCGTNKIKDLPKKIAAQKQAKIVGVALGVTKK
jgi:hypothetical protein